MDTNTMIVNENKVRGISGSTLKLIAIITMFIDHFGAVVLEKMLMIRGFGDLDFTQMQQVMQFLVDNAALYYTYTATRMIGRVAFPIFCFLLIEGVMKTKNINKYTLRLALFAIISEIPFDLAIKGEILEFSYQNVFFTLLIGLLTIRLFQFVESKKEEWFIVVRILAYLTALGLGMAIAAELKTDYSWIGVICIIALYIFRKNKTHQIIAGCIAFVWEITAPLAFIPIYFYNGTRGLKLKYIFYIFYPLHLFLLYLVCLAMGIS